MTGRGAALTQGSITGHLRRMAQPMVLALFALMGFNLADTWFVAQLGAPELAAMGFTFPVVMTLTSLGIGIMAGTSAVLARRIGAGDEEQVKRLARDALLLSLILGATLAAVGLATITPVFRALGATAELLGLIRDYMAVWYLSLPLILCSLAATGAIRATGDSTGQSLILVTGSMANLALDPLLIFGLAGFPSLGIQGAAWASVAARIIALVPAFYLFHVRHALWHPHWPRPGQLTGSARALGAVAVPAAGTNAIIPLATGVVTALLASRGAAAVAGFGAGSRVEGVSLIFFYALSAVIGPIVGQNLGAGQHRRSQEAVRASVRFCLLGGAVIAVILWAVAPPVAALFSRDQQIIAVAVSYLRILPLGFGAAGIVMVINAALNASGRPLVATGVSLARVFALQLPLAVLGSALGGIDGIFLGLVAGNMLAAGIAIVSWRRVGPRPETAL